MEELMMIDYTKTLPNHIQNYFYSPLNRLPSSIIAK